MSTQQTAPGAVEFSPLDVLTAAAVVITARGFYQSLSRPDEPAIPTAMDVTALLYGREPYERGDLARFAAARRTIEGIPAAVLAWCTTSTAAAPAEGSYRARLARIAAQRTVSDRDISILASAVASYFKDQQRAVRAAQHDADAARSVHVGVQGERVTRTAIVASVVRLPDREYGYTVQRRHMIKLRDEAGCILVWASSAAKIPAEGARVTITGSVSRHDTYRDTAQTYITRCRWTPAHA